LVIALADRKSSEKEAATKVLRADEDRILAVIDDVAEVLTRMEPAPMVCECRSWHKSRGLFQELPYEPLPREDWRRARDVRMMGSRHERWHGGHHSEAKLLY